MDFLLPPGWRRAKGYAHGVSVRGRMIFLSGLVGWDAEEKFVSDDLLDQVRQALSNGVALLSEAGARPQHVARMTWYIVDRGEYLRSSKQIGEVYRQIMGGHYPAMTLVQVSSLLESRARVEIEITAVIPDPVRE